MQSKASDHQIVFFNLAKYKLKGWEGAPPLIQRKKMPTEGRHFFLWMGGAPSHQFILYFAKLKKNNLVIAKGGAKIFMIFQILDFCHFLQKQKLGHQSNRRGHKIFGKIQKSEKSWKPP